MIQYKFLSDNLKKIEIKAPKYKNLIIKLRNIKLKISF